MTYELAAQIAERMATILKQRLAAGEYPEFNKYAIGLRAINDPYESRIPIRLKICESAEYRVPTPANRVFICDWYPSKDDWENLSDHTRDDQLSFELRCMFLAIDLEMQKVRERDRARFRPAMMCVQCQIREAHYGDEYCGYDALCEQCQDLEMIAHEAGRSAEERWQLKEARRFK